MKDENRQVGSLKILRLFCLFGGALALAGCSGLDIRADYPEKISSEQPYVFESENKETSVFGPGGFDIFNFGAGGNNTGGGGGGGAGIGVNSYLWRATLDTISFMPLNSADPFGGVIITDWYTPPESPKERFKMSVYILGRELRADGVKVAVFRQRNGGNGTWIDSRIGLQTVTNLENQILTRARQLRIGAANR